MKGAKRKPTGQLKVNGTYRKDRHGDRVDASHEFFSVPAMPTGMGPDAQRLWKMVVDELAAARVIAELDAPSLQSMCQWWQRYLDLHGAIGKLHITDDDAEDLENRARRAWQSFDKLACRFGMTPSDRAKLTATPQGKSGEDPLSSLGIAG